MDQLLMKNITKSQLPRWLENTSILWLVSIPNAIGVFIMILPIIFDIPNTKIDDLIWRGIAWGVIGLSFLAVILRKEFPLGIFLEIVPIKGVLQSLSGG
jgi:hypothetical protein